VDAYLAARAAAFDLLAAKGLPPGRRLRAHFAALNASIDGEDTRAGCLVGNMATEAAPISEAIRRRVREAYAAWTTALADALREAEAAGGLRDAPAPEVLAQILICGWEGAVQRIKADRNGEPLRAFGTLLDRFIPP
jgi:TetR/AcrR family transcriptional repressor of nem operon